MRSSVSIELANSGQVELVDTLGSVVLIAREGGRQVLSLRMNKTQLGKLTASAAKLEGLGR